MAPLLIAEGSYFHGELTDLALISPLDRRDFGAACRTSAHRTSRLVRAMNCYYSNLIEGHDTHPSAIERAIKNDYSNDPHQRDLQLEAKSPCSIPKNS